MQKIGIVTLYLGASGKKGFYNRQEVGMAKGYVSLGLESYIFFPDGNDTVEEENITKYITIVHCPGMKIGVHGRFDWNILKKYNIDYLQCNFDNQIFAPDLVRFCDKSNIPVFLYIGTIRSDSTSYLKRIIMSVLFKRSACCMHNHKCFVKTKAVADELKNYGIESEIVPVGLDIDYIPNIKENKKQIRVSLGLPQEKKIILFVGRIDTYKRPLEFIEIVKNIDDNYHAVMIGDGQLNDKLYSTIEKYKLNKKITWIKSIPNKDIHAYYKASDYFINLNNHEIFGMSILEAMYHGITVIAIKAPGPEMIIENGINGYLVNDIIEVERIIKEGNHCDYNQVIKRVKEKFCWDNIIGKIVNNFR